jgi:hypothetical protein
MCLSLMPIRVQFLDDEAMKSFSSLGNVTKGLPEMLANRGRT